jgi:hypothetical protein
MGESSRRQWEHSGTFAPLEMPSAKAQLAGEGD